MLCRSPMACRPSATIRSTADQHGALCDPDELKIDGGVTQRTKETSADVGLDIEAQRRVSKRDPIVEIGCECLLRTVWTPTSAPACQRPARPLADIHCLLQSGHSSTRTLPMTAARLPLI